MKKNKDIMTLHSKVPSWLRESLLSVNRKYCKKDGYKVSLRKDRKLSISF